MSNFDFEPELLNHSTDSSLLWVDVVHPSWTSFLRILIIFSVFIMICVQTVGHIYPNRDHEWKRGQFNEEIVNNDQLGEGWKLTPNQFPFPDSIPLRSHKTVKFAIPDAEFTLSVSIPQKWKKVNIRSDVVRFGTSNLLEGELKFSNTYLDREPTIEQNIATSLEQQITVEQHHYSYYSQSIHVLHWHIHHKTWVEYSLLYEDEEGQSWMHGVSLRWNPDWLNVIRCQYIAPVHIPQKNTELLHLAWDLWVSQFIQHCRKYEVVSWE